MKKHLRNLTVALFTCSLVLPVMPATVTRNLPEGIHPSLDSSNSRWDDGAGSLTITQDVVFNPASAENLDDVMENFYWNVPPGVKKVIIAENTRVTGHFRLSAADQVIIGEDRATSVIFGTDTKAWARGPNRVEDEGTRCERDGLPANVAGDDRVHDCEKWFYGAVSPAENAPAGIVLHVRNLTIENARTYAITAHHQAWHIDEVNIINTRPAPDWHSNSDGIGGGPGTVIRNTYIDTWDDSIKLYKNGFLVEDVTIVHNRNGSPFQLGWSDKPATRHTLRNITVRQAKGTEGQTFNLAMFANSRGQVDATVILDGVRAHYDENALLNKCGDEQPLPLVYLANAASRLTLVAGVEGDLSYSTPALKCGPGKLKFR